MAANFGVVQMAEAPAWGPARERNPHIISCDRKATGAGSRLLQLPAWHQFQVRQAGRPDSKFHLQPGFLPHGRENQPGARRGRSFPSLIVWFRSPSPPAPEWVTALRPRTGSSFSSSLGTWPQGLRKCLARTSVVAILAALFSKAGLRPPCDRTIPELFEFLLHEVKECRQWLCGSGTKLVESRTIQHTLVV